MPVSPRPTALNALAAATYVNYVFTATATLTDGLSSAFVSGKTVTFVYQGQTRTGATDGSGLAAATFGAGPSSGTYNYTAAFAADATYVASSDNANTVTVQERPTTLTAPPVTIYANEVFTASGTLTDDADGSGVSGKTISFVYAGQTRTGATIASGLAVATFDAGSSSGSYNYTAQFAGDATYGASSDLANAVTVQQRPTTVLAVTMPGVYANEVWTATATLRDTRLANAGVAGKTISFVYQGVTKTAGTDGSGVAVMTYNANASSGTYGYTASFAGDGTYTSASDAGKTVTVTPRPTNVVAVSAANVYTLSVWTATATLRDSLNTNTLGGKPISFVYQGTTRGGTTDGSGVATATF
ncbi:MAG TPA: hypothetical protein DD417_13745, partial [Elusimicrobia bacterium]|nr:hypothetical protein [Elusimicrobiota bacterium]